MNRTGTCRLLLNIGSMSITMVCIIVAVSVLSRRSDNAEIVRCVGVSLAYDETPVLDGVSFSLMAGRMKIILGASGSGKSTILKLVLRLLGPDAGEVWVSGARIDQLTEADLAPVRADIGMVFQEGALFDSLTVAENVGYRLYQEKRMSLEEKEQRVDGVLESVGLAEFAERMPAELSGGQRKRVAIARAIAARPRLILYDEPTTGLDPITSTAIDDEIIRLRDILGISSIMVTHQLRDAYYVATHQAVMRGEQVEIVPAAAEKAAETDFLMLRNGRMVFEGELTALQSSRDGYISTFLS
jgi:phospholipid/cholesterol/gamma-HCH transport system ATP-binding protein